MDKYDLLIVSDSVFHRILDDSESGGDRGRSADGAWVWERGSADEEGWRWEWVVW